MMSCSTVFLFIVLLQFLPRHTCNYIIHRINSTHGCNGGKNWLVLQNSIGAFVKYGPVENGRPVAFDCFLFFKAEHLGVVAVTQKLILRKREDGGCIDYIQFIQEKQPSKWEIGPEICGSFEFKWNGNIHWGKERVPISSPNLPWRGDNGKSTKERGTALLEGASVNYRGMTLLGVHIGKPTDEDNVIPELQIAIVPFKECSEAPDDSNRLNKYFNCGYNICIRWPFVEDWVANCPFRDIADEDGIIVMKVGVAHHPVRLVTVFIVVATAVIFISLGVLLYCIKFYCRATDRWILVTAEVEFDNSQQENHVNCFDASDTVTD